MNGSGRPFDPAELGEASADELVAATLVARSLEQGHRTQLPAPDSGFADRVMAAVAAEPLPQPSRMARRAISAGRPAMLLAAFRDAFRLVLSGGRPFAVRLQAAPLAVLGLLLILGGSSLVAVGASQLLRPSTPSVVVPTASPQTSSPTLLPSELSSPTEAPTDTPVESATPAPSVDAATPEPTSGTPLPTPSPTPGPTPPPTLAPTVAPTGAPPATPTATPARTGTPRPTHTATPTPSPSSTATPSESPSPTATGTETPKPSRTPKPSETPEISSTPQPTETPSGT